MVVAIIFSPTVGWVSGSHPTSGGETVDVKICIQSGSFKCKFSGSAKITHCGSYVVYKLTDVPNTCSTRYCGTQWKTGTIYVYFFILTFSAAYLVLCWVSFKPPFLHMQLYNYPFSWFNWSPLIVGILANHETLILVLV